jgi:hypothetical protein
LFYSLFEYIDTHRVGLGLLVIVRCPHALAIQKATVGGKNIQEPSNMAYDGRHDAGMDSLDGHEMYGDMRGDGGSYDRMCCLLYTKAYETSIGHWTI